MDGGDTAGAADGLHVEQARLHRLPDQIERGTEIAVDGLGDDAVEELGEILAIPPAIHIGLAQAQCALGQEPVPNTFVMDLDVPGIGAVDDDASVGEEGDDGGFLTHGRGDPDVTRVGTGRQGR